MLELKNLCFTIDKDGEPHNLVDDVSIKLPSNHFMAIVGPSGCGKTTLLRTIAGLNAESDGSIIWNGDDLAEVGDFEPQEIGYVPQFSIAYDELTVDESIETATKLRVKTRGFADLDNRIDRVLEVTGLAPLADRLVRVLSGGQKRRLGLAMELVSDPSLLLCDEVTSGLDPRSERDIMRLLHKLSRKDGRIIVSVTHSLAHLELYDSILVLHEGRVAYHGPPSQLTHYFSVEDTEEIYPRLSKQSSEVWQKSWLKHQEVYYKKIERYRKKKVDDGEIELPTLLSHTTDDVTTGEIDKQPSKEKESESDDILLETSQLEDGDEPKRKKRRKSNDDSQEIVKEEAEGLELPGLCSQFSTLLMRRFKIFGRDKGQILLQVAVLIVFPLLVIIFADQANISPPKFTELTGNVSESVNKMNEIASKRGQLGSALAGIVMFQIVLLSLMGSNNSAREIAGERPIWEKEKFGGVRPLAYLMSKVAFLSVLIVIQSVIMAIWVNTQWPFPGAEGMGFLTHCLLLIMVNASITFICLGVSAIMKTAEQASLLSIYIVGFQLPLSGAVLALPPWLGDITRPFISAYWSWSGSIKTMHDDQQQVIGAITKTPFNPLSACILVLLIHGLIGIAIAYIGTRKHRWDH